MSARQARQARQTGQASIVRVDPDRGGEWLMWRAELPEGEASSLGRTGEPGLWRRFDAPGGGYAHFAVPTPAALESTRDVEGDEASEFEAALAGWAHSTASGHVASGWSPPAEDELAAAFDDERLSVRVGPHVARGRIERDDDRVRVCFPEIVRLGPRLPAERGDWLRALCTDAQANWQLVRFDVVGQAVQAEVDLSGAPPELAGALARWAGEAIVQAVAWVLPSCAALADPDLACVLLERPPWWSTALSRTSTARGPANSITQTSPKEN